MTNMKSLADSMENAVRCRIIADSERRAKKAERVREEFNEALMKAETEHSEAAKLKEQINGLDAAKQRDQLMIMMMGL